MEPDDGPIQPGIKGLGYPAGQRWWIAGDHKWYPPPEPAELPGTTHQVGELKPTWEGMTRWDGTSWALQEAYTGDAEHFAAQPPAAFEQRREQESLQHRDEVYLAPPKAVDEGSVRVINLVLLTLGVASLASCVVLLVLHYCGVRISAATRGSRSCRSSPASRSPPGRSSWSGCTVTSTGRRSDGDGTAYA